jgi:hypothetical protein
MAEADFDIPFTPEARDNRFSLLQRSDPLDLLRY